MKTCLIVIDVQESFRHRPYFTESGTAAYLQVQNALIAGCEERGIPIVRVLHMDGPAQVDNPFALESGHVVPMRGLREFAPAASFLKRRHSALVGTGLDVWLTEQGSHARCVTLPATSREENLLHDIKHLGLRVFDFGKYGPYCWLAKGFRPFVVGEPELKQASQPAKIPVDTH